MKNILIILIGVLGIVLCQAQALEVNSELKKALFEKLDNPPGAAGEVEGRIYYDNTYKQPRYYTGGIWAALGSRGTFTSTMTADKTIGDDRLDAVFVLSISGGVDRTVFLPSATGLRGGRMLTFFRGDNTPNLFLKIKADGSEIVGPGSDNFFLMYEQNEFLVLQSDGVRWNILSHGPTRYQTKFLSQSETSTPVTLTDLSFSLEAGKYYKITFNPYVSVGPQVNSYADITVGILDGTTKIGSYRIAEYNGTAVGQDSLVITRKLADGALTFYVEHHGVTVNPEVHGGAGISSTHVTVEELVNYKETTRW